MKKKMFEEWLVVNYGIQNPEKIASIILRIEEFYGDIETLYNHDNCMQLLSEFEYSSQDKLNKVQPRHKIPIAAKSRDIYDAYYARTSDFRNILKRKYLPFLKYFNSQQKELINSQSLPNKSDYKKLEQASLAEKKYYSNNELEDLFAAADNGDVVAQHRIGECFREGNDYELAIKFHEMAAQQNNSDSLYILGFMHSQGQGVELDYRKALDYYSLAHKYGHVEAQFKLGVLYFLGHGTPSCYVKALDFFLAASNKKHPLANYHYGLMLANGRGVEQDKVKGFAYVLVAAALDTNDDDIKLGKVELEVELTVEEITLAQEIAQKIWNLL